jgi:hypothetical protein
MKLSNTIILLLLLSLIVSGCQNSYSDCKHNCLRYNQNCSIEGSFCIPSHCNTNHICSEKDMQLCIERCS